MSDPIQTPVLSVDDFFTFVEQHPDRRFNFMDGEVVEVSPKPLHGRLQADFTMELGIWAKQNAIGRVHTETLHVLKGEKFMPDISVNAQTADDQSYFDTPPLLAVEIRSDTQSRASQRRKAAAYIRHGTPAVLLVMPGEQIELFTVSTGDQPHLYAPGDIIENIPELPGLRIDVTRMFE